jgi:hypothetical protein
MNKFVYIKNLMIYFHNFWKSEKKIPNPNNEPKIARFVYNLPEYKAPQNYITVKRVYLLNTIIFTVTFLSLFYS